MYLTRTNWLVALRDEILKQGTLYPDGGDVGKLTKTNWLIKLRNDILARHSLYPSSEIDLSLTTTNWLRELRREILTSQTLFPESGQAGLSRIINRALELIDNTSVSVDGSDVQSSEYWTTQAVRDTFSTSISTAQSVLSVVSSDDDPRIDPAITTLNSAIQTFNSKREKGTQTPIQSGWELTYSQPSQGTMSRLIIPLSSFAGYTPDKLEDMNSLTGVYDDSTPYPLPTGNVRLFAKYVLSPPDDWHEVILDEIFSHRPYNRLITWEWDNVNVRITGDNSTGQPIQLRLTFTP